MTRFANLSLKQGGTVTVRQVIDRVRNIDTVSIVSDFWQLFKKIRRKMPEAIWSALFGENVPFERVNEYVNEAARLMLQLAIAEQQFCCGKRAGNNETKTFEVYVVLADNVATFAELTLTNTRIHNNETAKPSDGPNVERMVPKWFDYFKMLQRLAYEAHAGGSDAEIAKKLLMQRGPAPQEMVGAIFSKLRELLRRENDGDCIYVADCKTVPLALMRACDHVAQLGGRRTIVLLDAPIEVMLASSKAAVWLTRQVANEKNGFKNTLIYTTRRECHVYDGSAAKVKSLLYAIDDNIEIDATTDIATLALDVLSAAELQAKYDELTIRVPPSSAATRNTLRTLVQTHGSKCLMYVMFAASLASQQRTTTSAAKRSQTHRQAQPPPTEAQIAAAHRAADDIRRSNAKQTKPAPPPARPAAAASPNNHNKSGNQNRSSHLRKLPDSPANLHTFNELKPNELRGAVELIADGSIRAHVVRKLADADRGRDHDARIATAKAAWAIQRPELAVHACFVGVVAEIGAASIHADNLNEIMLTCRMPTQDDEAARRLASALANSTEALAELLALIRIKRAYLVGLVASVRQLHVQSAGFDGVRSCIDDLVQFVLLFDKYVYPWPMNLKYQMLASEASAFVPRLELLARSIDNSPRCLHNANVVKGLRLLRAIVSGHDNAAFPQRANAPINPPFQRESFSASIGDRLRYDRQNVAPVDAPTFSVGHASNDEAVLPENVDDLVCFKIKGMQRGVPLQTLQMPVFYAFKVNEGGNPFIERGIELTCGRFFGGTSYLCHDTQNRIELDESYVIGTDSGHTYNTTTQVLALLTNHRREGLSPNGRFFTPELAYEYRIPVTERTTAHERKHGVTASFLGATILVPTNLVAADMQDHLKTIHRWFVEAENLIRERFGVKLRQDAQFKPDKITCAGLDIDDALKQAHFDRFSLAVPPKFVFEQALERVWGNIKSQFSATRMRRMTSQWLIDFLSGQWGVLTASDCALIFLHFPWWIRARQSAMVRKNISKLDEEERADANGDDGDDDDDDEAVQIYSNFKLENFKELLATCSTRVVYLLASMVDASDDASDYHNKVRTSMRGETSAELRNSMRGLRDQIDQRLEQYGFTNDNAKSPVGRMRYAESLQRNVAADDLRGEMTQQLSPSPKPHDFEVPLTLSILAASYSKLGLGSFYEKGTTTIRDDDAVWQRLMPNWTTWRDNKRMAGQDLTDLPFAVSTDGVHVKLLVHYRNMPTASSLDAAGNNRSSWSWFASKTHKPTFDDISSILRASVRRLTNGGITWRATDERSHRGFCRDYGPSLPNASPPLDVAGFLARHTLIGCDIGEVVALAAVGVIGVVKASGKVELWNRYIKVTSNSKRHMANVSFGTTQAARGTGRTRATAIDERQEAMAPHSDRTFDAATFGAYSNAATTVRSDTSDAVRDAEREHHHRSFRNRQRWYAHLVDAVASLAVLGGDPVVFMGDYKSKRTRKGTRSGGVASKQIIIALSRRFVMLAVDERYTSQKSPITHQQIELAAADHIGRPTRQRNRLFVAQEAVGRGEQPVLLDRDVSASLNMVLLGLLKLVRGERPSAFEKPPAAPRGGRGRGARGGRGRGGRGGARGGAAVGGGGGGARGGRGAAAAAPIRRSARNVASATNNS